MKEDQNAETVSKNKPKKSQFYFGRLLASQLNVVDHNVTHSFALFTQKSTIIC
jgi:hypothetical protein